MIPAGYLYKQVVVKPEWLAPARILAVYSLGQCISEDFIDYFDRWRHNGWGLFDHPEVMEELAREEGIDLSRMMLFYYEFYGLGYDDESHSWSPIAPQANWPTAVVEPASKTLQGFDVVTFSCGWKHECSPLSCNYAARELDVNAHCLFSTFEAAKAAVDAREFDRTESGPFRIVAVYTVSGVPSLREASSRRTERNDEA